MNLKLFCFSVFTSIILLGCGGGGTETSSESSTNIESSVAKNSKTETIVSSEINDNTAAIFNIPNIQDSDSLPTNNLDKN